MTTSRKSGSALLIVLGFLSFMVVSAVAFAIYMRAERMPSSALRRAVATRHLVHAALAEAIARVDDAVRGDPFPGLCDTNTDFSAKGTYTYRDQRGQAMDVWQGRVFMPPDPLGGTTTRETRFAPVTETVSVLTLEGLGYLPPGLVNDVRFLSRSSWAAQWQQLPFDAGRFAFCAVNVSDYFDVNRVWANRGRTSEAGGRLSLGYLFDGSFNPAAKPGEQVGDVVNFAIDADKFDRFVHTTRPSGDDKGNDNTQAVSGNTTPYVSLLDYNLALGALPGKEKENSSSPLNPLFWYWIDGSTRASYYQDVLNNPQAKSAARQPFVTESVSTNESWQVDLATVEGQPFYGLDMSRQNEVREIYKVDTQGFFSRGQNILSDLDLFTLYDYLDHDNVPLSLAMPCVERVPMVTALEQTIKFEPQGVQAGQSTTTKEPGKKITSTPYEFDPQAWFPGGGGSLSASVVFPFKHGAFRAEGSFKVQAYVCAFLAPKELPLRGAFAKDLLQRDKSVWNPRSTAFEYGGDNDVFLFSACSDLEDVSALTEKEIQNDKEAGETVTLTVHLDDAIPSGKRAFVTKIETTTLDDDGNESGAPVTTWTINTRPFTDLSNGVLTPAPKGELTQQEFDTYASKVLQPYVCVWVRVVDTKNKNRTVDLVPACPQDDVFNDYDADDPLRTLLKDSFPGNGSDDVMPLLRFTGAGVDFSLGAASSAAFTGGTPTWTPKALYTLDPRFNWAPESWYTTSGSATFKDWLTKTKSFLEGDDSRDEDIFLFTSNQGILQSLGELAFLPNLKGMANANFSGAYAADDAAGQTLFAECAWTSYPITRDWYAQWAAQGVGRSAARECLVNPYTDNRAVMMAALANTPVDYWAAARNMQKDCVLRQKEDGKLYNTADDEIDTAKEALKRAFCTQSEDEGDKLQCQDLMSFADLIMEQMRTGTLKLMNGNMGTSGWNPANAWEEVWDGLPWKLVDNGDSPSTFLGVDLKGNVALHSVDRKFLRSYWRDCFANNQQLFLIFVRAESNALGGPGEGTPAQQGGRAVALVWRNPAATDQEGRTYDAQNQYNTSGERKPHQTRVLFYHQFD